MDVTLNHHLTKVAKICGRERYIFHIGAVQCLSFNFVLGFCWFHLPIAFLLFPHGFGFVSYWGWRLDWEFLSATVASSIFFSFGCYRLFLYFPVLWVSMKLVAFGPAGEILVISTVKINRVAFYRSDRATCMANLSPAEIQWNNLPLLFCCEAWCKNTVAYPTSFAEEILLG